MSLRGLALLSAGVALEIIEDCFVLGGRERRLSGSDDLVLHRVDLNFPHRRR